MKYPASEQAVGLPPTSLEALWGRLWEVPMMAHSQVVSRPMCWWSGPLEALQQPGAQLDQVLLQGAWFGHGLQWWRTPTTSLGQADPCNFDPTPLPG